VETTLRIWELARAARKGRQSACSNDRFKTVTKDNATSQENQYCDRDEEPIGKGESSAGAKNYNTGSIRAPAGKGGSVGRGYRRNKTAHRTYRLGGEDKY
jgi:hypothetical protein